MFGGNGTKQQADTKATVDEETGHEMEPLASGAGDPV